VPATGPARPGRSSRRQPSVYCADLRFLIDHIADRVRTDLTRLLGEQARPT
jgi:uncharacterized protein